jgi:hypothetical protein
MKAIGMKAISVQEQARGRDVNARGVDGGGGVDADEHDAK